MESLIINFFGGPGIGKSTQSSLLYSIMKMNDMDVEITYEFPKLMTWDGNISSISDQFYISANQHRNISRLYGKVKYIIIDSPIILGLYYKDSYNSEYPSKFYDETFDNFLLTLFKKYNNLNIFLNRSNKNYEEKGRLQGHEESLKIDKELKDILIFNEIDFIDFDVNEKTSMKIYEYIKGNNL